MSSAEDRIARVIAEYDSQGWHRTGTGVDEASALWLAEELQRRGVDASVEWYPFERRTAETAFLELGAETIHGVPLFDSPGTPAEGVSGRFGDEIALVFAPPGGGAVLSAPLVEARRSNALAIVLVGVGGRPGLALRNAESYREWWGPPVLQVPSDAGEALRAAAGEGRTVRLVAPAGAVQTRAGNVVGRAPGRDPGLPPVCVMTPRSGWWHCASERGGGIACWLEAAAAAVSARPLRDVEFVASTGHELGHWGLDEYLARRPGLASGAHLWFHFGASIGAAIEPRANAVTSSPELGEALLGHLRAHDAPLPTLAPAGTEPGGESRNIHRAGGRYVSLLGGSAVFHLEADRWPEAVDVPAVGRIAAAMARMICAAANSP